MGSRPYTFSQIEAKPDGGRRPFSLKLTMPDTDLFKCLIHSRIKTPIEAPGAFHTYQDGSSASNVSMMQTGV